MSELQLSFDFLLEPARVPASTPLAPADAPVGPAEPRYELRRGPRRRTLGIEVHPDLRVVVRVPKRCSAVDISAFLAERAAWVEAQLNWFRAQPPVPVQPAFHDGELHHVLGRAHRLRLAPDAPDGISLDDDLLVIGGRAASSTSATHKALARWLRERAMAEFGALLDTWHRHPRFARYPRPALCIRAMRSRWGSLGSRRGMTLNLALIHAPRACIEYVVVHELCHLRYRGHGRGFYALLEALLPDWRERSRLLEASVRSVD